MADGQKIGNAYLSVKAQPDKSFKSELENAGSSAGESAGNLFNGKFGAALKKVGGVVAALGVGKMIGDVIAESIQAYANYEQLVGGVETLFKDSADLVQQYAANAYKNQGISANSYMETVTSFSASLLQSLGGDTEKAAKYADMAISDMSDNANKMGTAMSSIQLAYQGFARGQYGLLDNLKLGYGGTRSEMERLLADAEKLSGVKYDISNLSDVYDAIHVIQTEMGITGTTAQEAATTIQGSFNMMKAAWDNLLVALADPEADFSAIFGNMVDSASTLLANAIPILGNLLGEMIVKLPEAIEQLAPILVDAIVRLVLKVGETFMNGLDQIFTDFGNWVAKLVNGTDEAGDQMAQATGEGVDEAVAEVKRLPSETDAALANLDYSDSGYAVGHSFAQGILGRIGEVSNASMQLALAASAPLPHSPAKIGPFSGRGWTLYSGESVADAFAEGFTRRMAAVQAQIASGMGGIASTISRGTATTYNIDMSVTADSATTLDSLINQARRARTLQGGY